MKNESLQSMKRIKLQGMATAYEAILSLPINKHPEAHEMVARLIDAEAQDRVYRRTKMYLKLCKLRYLGSLSDIHCSSERNLKAEQLALLADGAYITRGETYSSPELPAAGSPSWPVPWDTKLVYLATTPSTTISIA